MNRRRYGPILAFGALLVLTACAERISFGNFGWLGRGESGQGGDAVAATPGSKETTATQPSTPPPVAMAGRWTFSSPGSGSCAMNFTGSTGAAEGAIAPEGGCPGAFFTSRRWVYTNDRLVIRNHTGDPLAELVFAGGNRFDGEATSGESVTLTR